MFAWICVDTKSGPRCDVSQPLVLTGIRQDVSSATCVAAMIHFHVNTVRAHPKLFPPVLASQTCFNVPACLGFWNTRFDSWFWDRKSRRLGRSFARLGPCRIFAFVGPPCRKQTLFPVGNVDSRDLHLVHTSVLGLVSVAVFQDKNTFILKASASRSKFSSSRDHARPHRSSFALTTVLTMDARRFQTTFSLSGMGSSLNGSKDIGTGGTDCALIRGSEPVMDAVGTALVGSVRIGHVLHARSDREDRSSDVCHVSDTR